MSSPDDIRLPGGEIVPGFRVAQARQESAGEFSTSFIIQHVGPDPKDASSLLTVVTDVVLDNRTIRFSSPDQLRRIVLHESEQQLNGLLRRHCSGEAPLPGTPATAKVEEARLREPAPGDPVYAADGEIARVLRLAETVRVSGEAEEIPYHLVWLRPGGRTVRTRVWVRDAAAAERARRTGNTLAEDLRCGHCGWPLAPHRSPHADTDRAWCPGCGKIVRVPPPHLRGANPPAPAGEPREPRWRAYERAGTAYKEL